jgi:hypothetical protein
MSGSGDGRRLYRPFAFSGASNFFERFNGSPELAAERIQGSGLWHESFQSAIRFL